MSDFTIQVDQFLLNKLQPEVDKLNLSLISMEEYGYDNKPMRETRNKLNKLISIYDFLKEYAHGKEEMEINDITDIMKIAGAYSSSTKSHTPIIQSTRDILNINETGGCLDFIRIYINDEISKTNTLSPISEFTTIKIYASDDVESIEVTMSVSGELPETYTGVNHVTISDVELDLIDAIILDIITINACGETIEVTKTYAIKDLSCSASMYWIGGTAERFWIHATTQDESTEISFTPNSGTKEVTVDLDYAWMVDPLNLMTEYIFREKVTHSVTVVTGDCHALLLIPDSLIISDVNELVNGSPIDMDLGTHYDTFQITSPTLKHYNCVYFRDLTTFNFTEDREFQFTLNTI